MPELKTCQRCGYPYEDRPLKRQGCCPLCQPVRWLHGPGVEDEAASRAHVDEAIREASLSPEQRYAVMWLRQRELELAEENARLGQQLIVLRTFRCVGRNTTPALIDQLFAAAKAGDSSLHEMAALRLQTLAQKLEGDREQEGLRPEAPGGD